MKLSTLKRSAQSATAWRGHKMSWQHIAPGDAATFAVCRHCGMHVTCLTRPAPNEIDISGPAVALNCLGPRS